MRILISGRSLVHSCSTVQACESAVDPLVVSYEGMTLKSGRKSSSSQPQVQQSHPNDHHSSITEVNLALPSQKKRNRSLLLQTKISPLVCLWFATIDRRHNGGFQPAAILRSTAFQQALCVHLLLDTALARCLPVAHSATTGCIA